MEVIYGSEENSVTGMEGNFQWVDEQGNIHSYIQLICQ
jgi:hypothetical protein